MRYCGSAGRVARHSLREGHFAGGSGDVSPAACGKLFSSASHFAHGSTSFDTSPSTGHHDHGGAAQWTPCGYRCGNTGDFRCAQVANSSQLDWAMRPEV